MSILKDGLNTYLFEKKASDLVSEFLFHAEDCLSCYGSMMQYLDEKGVSYPAHQNDSELLIVLISLTKSELRNELQALVKQISVNIISSMKDIR